MTKTSIQTHEEFVKFLNMNGLDVKGFAKKSNTPPSTIWRWGREKEGSIKSRVPGWAIEFALLYSEVEKCYKIKRGLQEAGIIFNS